MKAAPAAVTTDHVEPPFVERAATTLRFVGVDWSVHAAYRTEPLASPAMLAWDCAFGSFERSDSAPNGASVGPGPGDP